MNPLLKINSVIVKQGEDFSLSIENLEILPRRIYALTGPNGAGKSTLLKLLAFLMPVERGTILLADCRGKAAEHRRKITLVEQTPYLFDGSVGDNIAYGLRLRGIRGRELQERIESVLDRVGLGGFARRRSDNLSGGEAQRVALARALALQPEVLLLDEPTANIDNRSLGDFEALLRRLPEEGVTVVISTHDLQQPQRLGSDIIRIENGRLLNSPHRAARPSNLTSLEQQSWLKALNRPVR